MSDKTQALYGLDGFITVYRDYQKVSKFPGGIKVACMSNMKYIETSVGEDDLFALFFEYIDLLFRVRKTFNFVSVFFHL